MAFDNTKYDVELNGVGHRIKGYQKTEAPTFIPRVGGGSQSESEFNLLSAKTIDGFEGGMLQRYWKDDKSVFATEGLYPIYDDGVLYPVNSFTSATDLTGKAEITATCQGKDYVFIAVHGFTGGNAVYRIDRSGTKTTITIPSNLSSSSRSITSMCIWNNQVWFGTSDGGTQCYLDLGSTTAAEITGSGGYYLVVVLNGQLYGTNANSQNINSDLYRWTGSTSARGFTLVGTTGIQVPDYTARLFVFNNRIWLWRKDGIFAFDGIRLASIEMPTEYNEGNYLLATPFKGYVYYFMADGMYRYNGSLVEKLYDISEIGAPVDMIAGKNRLWILYANFEGNSSRYDKAMGYDYFTGNNIDGRVAVFNGKGLYTYARTSTFSKNPGSDDIANQGSNKKLLWFNDKLWVFTNYDKIGPGTYYHLQTNETTLTGTKSWRLVTSIFNGDFAMIDKNIDNLELVLDGTVVSESITLEHRTGGFDGSSGWTSSGSFNTTTELKRYIWKTLTSGLSSKRVQFRLSGTTTAGYGLAKLIVRYTLAPDFKWEWQFTVLNYGDSTTAPLVLADGTNSTQSVRSLRGNIYAARSSDIPVKYIDIDQLDLNGAHNNSTTTITVNSTSLLKGDDGFIQIDDEIMYWYAKTSTTLTVVRAVLGTAAASHSDNAKVFIVYRVLVNRLQQERVILDDDGRRATEDVDTPTETILQLREV